MNIAASDVVIPSPPKDDLEMQLREMSFWICALPNNIHGSVVSLEYFIYPGGL